MKRSAWLAGGAAIALVAFALRAYLLDGQSLWYDEGITAAMAPRGFAAITGAAAADIHPPLYYYFLHIWAGLAGTTEYALRFFSLLGGVLLPPLLAQVGRRMFRPAMGLLVAWLAATAPLLVYYSQEARMYSLLLLLGTLAVYVALRLPSARRPGWTAVGLSVIGAAILYTHYLGPVLLGVVALFLLASAPARRRWRWWVGALAAATAAWSPWALISLGKVVQRVGPAMDEWVPFSDYLARVLAVFSYGLSFDATLTGRSWGLALLLLVAALWWAWRGGRGLGSPVTEWNPGAGRGFLGPMRTSPVCGEEVGGEMSPRLAGILTFAWLAVPVLATYGLWLYRPLYNPVINPRFALPAAPAFYLWLALGITGLAAAVSWLQVRLRPPQGLSQSAYPFVVVVTSLALLFFSARSLQAYYFEPKYARDDYRGLARYIESQARPSDAIVLDAPGQAEIFGYYYRPKAGRANPVRPLPSVLPIDRGRTVGELEALGGGHPRVWLVLWAEDESDPEGIVRGWLSSQGIRLEEEEFGNVRLELYELRPGGGVR